MRILVATGTWPPEQNGVTRVAVGTAQALAERGHDVSVLAPRVRGLPDSTQDDGLRVYRWLDRGRVPLILSDVLRSRRLGDRVPGPFDVVLAHGSMLTTGIARAGLDAPVVLVYHASLRREFRFARTRLAWGKERFAGYALEPAAALLDHAALRAAARILVLSSFTASLLEADHGGRPELDRVRLVSGGVDIESFAPTDGPAAARARLGVEPDGTLVVSVRRADPRMGLEQLLQACAQLLSRQHDLRVAIVGGGPLQHRLRALGNELGLTERVRFEGHVSEHDLRDWYRAADLFVLPTVAYEGFGMVTAEALSTGTPVVATPVGATPELLRPLDPRLLAKRADADALAEAMAEALTFATPAFRVSCRDYARSRFAWPVAVEAWEAALLEAVAA